MDDCQPICQTTCDADQAFVRLRVRPTIRHGATVEWLLHPNFNDPGPHTFQLQVGHTGSNLADDWQDVGLPAENVSYLVDDRQRVFGQTQWTHYRVKLTTPAGQYVSQPQHAWGDLPYSQWRLLLSREKEWRLQLKRTHRGQAGLLLKRRLTGEVPADSTDILDYQTQEIVKAQAAETVGTEFLGGYYAAIPCVYAELSEVVRREHLDASRGTVNDLPRVLATMLAVPQVDSYDVWVSAQNDLRWAAHRIKHKEEISGVPVTLEVELRLLPFTHPVYQIEV